MSSDTPFFTDEHPAIGAPHQIAWYFGGDENARYSLLYADFNLDAAEIAAISEFVTQRPGITGAEAFPGHPNRVIITCDAPDADFAILMWLQQAFQPSVPYTALARAFVAVEPMVVSIAFIGEKPHSYEGFLRELVLHDEIERAHHDPRTDTLVVIFRKLEGMPAASDDDDAALAQTFLSALLGAQWYAAVTVIVNRTHVPVDRAAVEEGHKTDE